MPRSRQRSRVPPRQPPAVAIWSAQIRYLGVGAMLIGGIWTLISLRKSVLSGFKSGLAATRAGNAGAVIAETEARVIPAVRFDYGIGAGQLREYPNER